MKYRGFIYCITNKVNGKRYVGQTLQKGGVNARWNYHISELNRNKHHSKHLQRAWNKYGKDNFIFEVLHELNFSNQDTLLEALNDLETMYISIWHLLDINYGYNIASGGSNGNPYAGKSEEEIQEWKNKIREYNIGKKLSKETKQKIGEASKGRKHSEETRKKLSEANKGNKNCLGRKYTEETIKKLSESHKGIKHTEETRKKLSEINKGRKFSEETRKKISEAGKGRKFSEEARKKMSENNGSRRPEVRKKISEAKKGKALSEEHRKNIGKARKGKPIHTEEEKKRRSEQMKGKNNPFAKKVKCIELDIIFDCIADANEYLGNARHYTGIANCARGGQKTAYGYHWEYV